VPTANVVAAELANLHRLARQRPGGAYARALAECVDQSAGSFRKAKATQSWCDCLEPLLRQVRASAKESKRLVALDVLGGLFYVIGKKDQMQLMQCLFSALERDLSARPPQYLPLAYLLSANYAGISDRRQREMLVRVLSRLQEQHAKYQKAAFVTDLVQIYRKGRLAYLERRCDEAFSPGR